MEIFILGTPKYVGRFPSRNSFEDRHIMELLKRVSEIEKHRRAQRKEVSGGKRCPKCWTRLVDVPLFTSVAKECPNPKCSG